MFATSHGSAARPKASREVSSSSSSSVVTLARNGCIAMLGATALTRTPNSAASIAAQRVKRHHARFRRGVVGLSCLRAPSEHRSVVDDHARVPRLEMTQRGAHAPERARQRHVEHLGPLFVGHVDDVRGPTETRVVDDHVEAAGRVDAALENSDCTCRSSVTSHGIDAATASPSDVGRLAEASFVGVADHHTRPFLDAALGRREPDAGAGRRGDEHALAGEQLVAVDVRGRVHDGPDVRRS